MRFPYFVCFKSQVFFLSLSLNDLSEALKYLLQSLLVSSETFVSYIILGVRHSIIQRAFISKSANLFKTFFAGIQNLFVL